MGKFTNNYAKYEALLKSLEIFTNIRAQRVVVKGESQLVINHMTGASKCKASILSQYILTAKGWSLTYSDPSFTHIAQLANTEANDLAEFASGFTKNADILKEIGGKVPEIETMLKRNDEKVTINSLNIMDVSCDWRKPINEYLDDPSKPPPKKMKVMAIRHVLMEGKLYDKTP